MIRQLLILFLLQLKKNSKDEYNDSDGFQESHDSDDGVTVDGDYFFLRITKTIMYAAMI